MAEAGIQALLDPSGLRRGIQILRNETSGLNSVYYCDGGVTAPSKAKWTTLTTAASDATNAAAITANMIA